MFLRKSYWQFIKYSMFFGRNLKGLEHANHTKLVFFQHFSFNSQPRYAEYTDHDKPGLFKVRKNQTTCELRTSMDVLLDELSTGKCTQRGDKIEKIQINLTSILHELYVRREANLNDCFEKIGAHNALNEFAYYILIQYHADHGDFHNVCSVFNMLKDNKDATLQSKYFIYPIIGHLKFGDYQICANYLTEMVELMGPLSDHHLFPDIINTCAELRTTATNESLSVFMDKLLTVLEERGFDMIDTKLKEPIYYWFKSDPMAHWSIRKTTMINGICRGCMNSLKELPVHPDHLNKMKDDLLSYVKIGIHEKKNHLFKERTSFNAWKNTQRVQIKDEVHSEDPLETYIRPLRDRLDKNGPFDIVIDSLNVTEVMMHNTNTNLDGKYLALMDVVKPFVEQKKKILIILCGYFHMNRHLLTMQSVSPADKTVHKVLKYLDWHCSLVFAPQSVDDHYILYTLIHHNFNIQLVSNDRFHDHQRHLDYEGITVFQNWQRANQYRKIKECHNVELSSIHPGLQNNDGVWHFPTLGNKKTWYCISSIKY